jgi:hypothetical protein
VHLTRGGRRLKPASITPVSRLLIDKKAFQTSAGSILISRIFVLHFMQNVGLGLIGLMCNLRASHLHTPLLTRQVAMTEGIGK